MFAHAYNLFALCWSKCVFFCVCSVARPIDVPGYVNLTTIVGAAPLRPAPTSSPPTGVRAHKERIYTPPTQCGHLHYVKHRHQPQPESMAAGSGTIIMTTVATWDGPWTDISVWLSLQLSVSWNSNWVLWLKTELISTSQPEILFGIHVYFVAREKDIQIFSSVRNAMAAPGPFASQQNVDWNACEHSVYRCVSDIDFRIRFVCGISCFHSVQCSTMRSHNHAVVDGIAMWLMHSVYDIFFVAPCRRCCYADAAAADGGWCLRIRGSVDMCECVYALVCVYLRARKIRFVYANWSTITQ